MKIYHKKPPILTIFHFQFFDIENVQSFLKN
jgi:hypothetical protein